jgi:hypothetical protein
VPHQFYDLSALVFQILLCFSFLVFAPRALVFFSWFADFNLVVIFVATLALLFFDPS